jgi:hypothetical protein
MAGLKGYTWVECPYCHSKYWLPNFMLGDERADEHKKTFCPNTELHIKIIREERFNSVSKEKRQEILDLLRTGITVGEVAKKLELDSDVVAEVICRNIDSVCYLRKETV